MEHLQVLKKLSIRRVLVSHQVLGEAEVGRRAGGGAAEGRAPGEATQMKDAGALAVTASQGFG